MSRRTSPWSQVMACLLGALLAGCAVKSVPLVPLAPGEADYLRRRFQEFQDAPGPTAIDADVRLNWNYPGKINSVSGMLRCQAPAWLYFRVGDPLGRPLFIVASDGQGFTMTDNREGKGYIGSVESEFMRKYLPPAVEPGELFAWLSGRPAFRDAEIVKIGRDREGEEGLVLRSASGSRHQLRFDPVAGEITRHQVIDNDDTVLFAVDYSDYTDGEGSWRWPRTLVVSGRDITGNVTITFDKIYSFASFSPESFMLHIPSHYEVEVVR